MLSNEITTIIIIKFISSIFWTGYFLVLYPYVLNICVQVVWITENHKTYINLKNKQSESQKTKPKKQSVIVNKHINYML